MKNKLNIGIVSLTMASNGFPKGFILKREPTVSETMHILQKILGFANEDYKDWFDSEEEREDYRERCMIILTSFLKGGCDWPCLCSETHCYDDDETGFPMPSAFPLTVYLKHCGIIE